MKTRAGRGGRASGYSLLMFAAMTLVVIASFPYASQAQTTANAGFAMKNQWAVVTVDNSSRPDLGKVTSAVLGCVEFNDDQTKCTKSKKINCPADTKNPGGDNDVCEASFKTGTKLTLTVTTIRTASPCVQWTLGDGTTTVWGKSVAVTPAGDTSLSINMFDAGAKQTVSVTVDNATDATSQSYVNSVPAGISKCGTANGVCEYSFPECTKITLNAYSGAGQFFTGWGADGQCAGSTTVCSFTLYPSVGSAKKVTNIKLGKPGSAKSTIEPASESK